MARKRRRSSSRTRGFFVKRGKIQWVNVLLVLVMVGLAFCQVLKWNTQAQSNSAIVTQKEAFIKKVAPIAQTEQKQYHVFASITIAQAALESNWGTSDLATKYNNLFGVKADATIGTLMTTKEYSNGQWIVVKAYFAIYSNWQESIQAHTLLFVNGTKWDANHYQDVINATNYKQAALSLQKKGYATDPNYAQKLIELIDEYDLNRYDN